MFHLLVALYVLGALLGVAAAMFINHYRLVFGFPFFRPFVRFLLCFSLIMLVLVSTYYTAANLAPSGPDASAPRILWAFSNNFIGFFAFSGWLVFFLQVLRGFEGKTLAPRTKTLLTVLIAGFCCSYGIGFGLAIVGTNGSWLKWSRNIYNLVVPVLLMSAMTGLLRRVRCTDFVIPRRSVRAFLLLYSSAYLISLALPMVFSRSALLILALVLPATNILPFVWVRQFFLREIGIVEGTVVGAVPIDAIAERCQLTGREREVVGYLLKGSSNAEIGEALFISVGTVKNHVYNIFKKLGVKSRGQLYRSVCGSGKDAPKPGA